LQLRIKIVKKILVLGASGMIGHKVFEVISKYENYEVFGKSRADSVFADKIETVEKVIKEIKPNVVINCIGITKQSDQIRDIKKSIIVNALFPHQLAEICKQNNCKLITFTTDCVFDGKKGNYKDDDLPTCQDVYGMTKYLGEVRNDKNVLTLRTSMIGHELNSKLGLLQWFLSQEKAIKGYKKAIFSGFTTLEFSKLLAEKIIPNEGLNGFYQISVNPISKYDLLKLIAKVYKKEIEIIPDETVKIDRSLNSDILRGTIQYNPPSWDNLIKEMYDEFQK